MTFGEELNIAENRAREERSNEIAMNMLEMNLDTHVIAKATGLSLEEIQKLKQA